MGEPFAPDRDSDHITDTLNAIKSFSKSLKNSETCDYTFCLGIINTEQTPN